MLNKVEGIVFTDNLDAVKQDIFCSKNRFCLIICLTGSIQLTKGTENFIVKSDEAIIWHVDMLVGHYMRTPDFTGYLLSIDDKMLKELLVEVCRIEPRWWQIMRALQSDPILRPKDPVYRNLMKSYFQLLTLYLTSEQTDYRKRTYLLLAKAASYEVLAGMNKIIRNEEPDSREENSMTAADRLLRNFIEILRNDDGTHREVAWYAEKLNITPKYLSFVCKEKAKLTASQIIQQVTCERIKHYLLNTDMNIKEIAYRLQFPTLSFFCKYVKQHLDASPMEIRRGGN